MRIGRGAFRPLRGCRLDDVLSRGLRPWLLTTAPPGLKMRNFKKRKQGWTADPLLAQRARTTTTLRPLRASEAQRLQAAAGSGPADTAAGQAPTRQGRRTAGVDSWRFFCTHLRSASSTPKQSTNCEEPWGISFLRRNTLHSRWRRQQERSLGQAAAVGRVSRCF